MGFNFPKSVEFQPRRKYEVALPHDTLVRFAFAFDPVLRAAALGGPQADDLVISPGRGAKSRWQKINGLPNPVFVNEVRHGGVPFCVKTDLTLSRLGLVHCLLPHPPKLEPRVVDGGFDGLAGQIVRRIVVGRDRADDWAAGYRPGRRKNVLRSGLAST
jgi:hypothetical protein